MVIHAHSGRHKSVSVDCVVARWYTADMNEVYQYPQVA